MNKNPSAKENRNKKDQEEENNNNDLQSKYLTTADPKEFRKKRLRWKDLPTEQGE